jgi:hypothetical protein
MRSPVRASILPDRGRATASGDPVRRRATASGDPVGRSAMSVPTAIAILFCTELRTRKVVRRLLEGRLWVKA